MWTSWTTHLQTACSVLSAARSTRLCASCRSRGCSHWSQCRWECACSRAHCSVAFLSHKYVREFLVQDVLYLQTHGREPQPSWRQTCSHGMWRYRQACWRAFFSVTAIVSLDAIVFFFFRQAQDGSRTHDEDGRNEGKQRSDWPSWRRKHDSRYITGFRLEVLTPFIQRSVYPLLKVYTLHNGFWVFWVVILSEKKRCQPWGWRKRFAWMIIRCPLKISTVPEHWHLFVRRLYQHVCTWQKSLWQNIGTIEQVILTTQKHDRQHCFCWKQDCGFLAWIVSRGIYQDSNSTSGKVFCAFGPQTFVSISWISYCSVASEIISLDAGFEDGRHISITLVGLCISKHFHMTVNLGEM